MNEKFVIAVLAYLIAHVFVQNLVTDKLRDKGYSEQDAQLGGHAAGAVAGFALSRAV